MPYRDGDQTRMTETILQAALQPGFPVSTLPSVPMKPSIVAVKKAAWVFLCVSERHEWKGMQYSETFSEYALLTLSWLHKASCNFAEDKKSWESWDFLVFWAYKMPLVRPKWPPTICSWHQMGLCAYLSAAPKHQKPFLTGNPEFLGTQQRGCSFLKAHILIPLNFSLYLIALWYPNLSS